MRHLIAGAVLIFLALVVTFGAATVLQNMAESRNPQSNEYVPPSLASPSGKPKPADGSRVMLSRRMNDEQNIDRSDSANE